MGEEEVGSGGDPSLLVQGQSAGGDEHVPVGVKVELSVPCVEDGGDAEASAEPLLGEVGEHAGAGACHEWVDEVWVSMGERSQLSWQGEDDLEVGCGEHSLCACVEPLGRACAVALGAVSVVAGLVDGLSVAAVLADHDVAAERTGAARQEALEDTSAMGVAAVVGPERLGVLPKRPDHRVLRAGPARGSAVVVQDLHAVEGRAGLCDAVSVDASVAGGGARARVSEEDLYVSEVVAVFEEPGGEGAPEVVRADAVWDVALPGAESVGHTPGGDGVVGPGAVSGADASGGEEEGGLRSYDGPVALEEAEGAGREHDGASLVALAAPDVDESGAAVDVVDLQGHGFGDAQAGGEHDGEEGVVVGMRRQAREEGLDFRAGEGAAGEQGLDAGAGHVVHGGLAADTGEEALHGGVVDRAGRRRAAEVGEVEQEAAGVLGGQVVDGGHVVVPEEDGSAGEVLIDGALREAAKTQVVTQLLTDEVRGFSLQPRG